MSKHNFEAKLHDELFTGRPIAWRCRTCESGWFEDLEAWQAHIHEVHASQAEAQERKC